MANHKLLNNVEHKDLRIVTTRSAALGDDVMSALTFPAEFRNLQAHYPIVFLKRPEPGQFQPIALFGFEARENLFLGADGWDAPYIPMTVERQPFLIGPNMVIHIDMDSPRISHAQGEAVFLPLGGTSEFLERMKSLLLTIHEGIEATPGFIAALLEFDLLESFTLDVELKSGSEHRLAGFYTINEETLGKLDGAALAKLQRAGHLLPIYMVLASLSNFRSLIDRRSRRLRQ